MVHCSHRQHILDSLLLLYTARKYCVLLIVASFTRPTSSQQQGQSRRGDYNFSLAKSRPIVARCNYNASSCNLFFIVRNSGNILVKSVYFYLERLLRCDDAYFVQLFLAHLEFAHFVYILHFFISIQKLRALFSTPVIRCSLDFSCDAASVQKLCCANFLKVQCIH